MGEVEILFFILYSIHIFSFRNLFKIPVDICVKHQIEAELLEWKQAHRIEVYASSIAFGFVIVSAYFVIYCAADQKTELMHKSCSHLNLYSANICSSDTCDPYSVNIIKIYEHLEI